LRWLKTGDADEEEIYTDSSAFLKVRKYKLQFQMFAFWHKKILVRKLYETWFLTRFF